MKKKLFKDIKVGDLLVLKEYIYHGWLVLDYIIKNEHLTIKYLDEDGFINEHCDRLYRIDNGKPVCLENGWKIIKTSRFV